MERKQNKWTLEMLTTMLVLCAALVILTNFAFSYSVGPNNRNITVDTILNITNSFPEIISIVVHPNTITLNAGTTVEVTVNTTIRDYDGFGDITGVNVTFFDALVANASSADDRNDHYTNSSCLQLSGSGFIANYSCSFLVYYHANNGTNWTANATVIDDDNSVATRTNISTINQLLAINVTPLIDYGNLAVGQTSGSPEQANVTNFGNVLINVTVYGYGNQTNDGLAMVCTQRNISIGSERFSTNSSLPFASMTAMASSAQNVDGWQLPQQTVDGDGGLIRNSTYWRITVPVSENPAGQCNGSVVFQAELAD